MMDVSACNTATTGSASGIHETAPATRLQHYLNVFQIRCAEVSLLLQLIFP